MEGSYPLWEAQIDRIPFKIAALTLELDNLMKVVERTTGTDTPEAEDGVTGAEILETRALARDVPIASHVASYASRLVLATHPEGKFATGLAKKCLRHGASPRARSASLVLSAPALRRGAARCGQHLPTKARIVPAPPSPARFLPSISRMHVDLLVRCVRDAERKQYAHATDEDPVSSLADPVEHCASTVLRPRHANAPTSRIRQVLRYRLRPLPRGQTQDTYQ